MRLPCKKNIHEICKRDNCHFWDMQRIFNRAEFSGRTLLWNRWFSLQGGVNISHAHYVSIILPRIRMHKHSPLSWQVFVGNIWIFLLKGMKIAFVRTFPYTAYMYTHVNIYIDSYLYYIQPYCRSTYSSYLRTCVCVFICRLVAAAELYE